MNDTAIVIVAYNSAQVIGACVGAAVKSGAEVLVIDNASTDATAEIVRRYPVRLTVNRANRGFAGAVNQGVRETEAAYILLLNPDAILEGDIGVLRTLCENPSVGAAAGLLLGAIGEPQLGFTARRLPTPAALSFEVLGLNRIFPRNPVNWRFRCFDLQLSGTAPVRVEQPAGAFLMFRRTTWESVEGFDEQFYPLWFEDVDFCARLRQLGKRVLLVPNVAAKHTGAHSILNMALEIREIYWYGNLLRYALKHYSPPGRKIVCASVFAGAWLRYGNDLIHRQNARSEVWKRIARLAVGCFLGRPGWDQFARQDGAPAVS